jgi:hypothetical protein
VVGWVTAFVSAARAIGLPLISAVAFAETFSSLGEQADRAMTAQAETRCLRRVMVNTIAALGLDSRNRLRRSWSDLLHETLKKLARIVS